MANIVEAGNPKALSSGALVKTGGGSVVGVFCATAGAGNTSTLALCDATASAASAGVGRFVAPFVLTKGTYYKIPASFGTGLFVSLAGSAASVTVIYNPAS